MSFDAAVTTPAPWRGRFEALVRDRMREPFAWGVHDCCLWAADAVHAVSGTDPAAKWRGTYTDAAGAARLLAELGGIAAVGALGGDEIAPLLAGVGDVGLVTHEGRDSLAVCAGHVWLAPAARGLAALPLKSAVKAWRVRHAASDSR